MVQTELERNRAKMDSDLQGEELIVNAMVHEQVEKVWACGKVKRAQSDVNKGVWLASKYDAVTTALQLAGKDKVPDNADDLLTKRKPLIDLLYSTLGADLLSSRVPVINFDPEDDDKDVVDRMRKLVDVMHKKLCTDNPSLGDIGPHGIKRKNAGKPSTPNKKPTLGAHMDLAAKRVVLDQEGHLIKFRQNATYPDYSYITLQRYFTSEQAVLDELYPSITQKTIESIKDYVKRTNVSKEKVGKMIGKAMLHHKQAGGATKISSSFDEEMPMDNAVPLTVEFIKYVVPVTVVSPSFSLGLLDIHESKAFQRVPTHKGSKEKVCVCPWCGHPASNQAFICGHVRREHYGILLVCSICNDYGNF